MWKQWQILFSWAPKSLWTLTATTKLKHPCSLEGRKVMKNLDGVLKTEIHFAIEVCSVKTMIFPVVIYTCENCSIKKVECQRTDAFKFLCRKRHLRIPLTARSSNQSILKEINPEYLLEGLMIQQSWWLDAKTWLIGKDSDAGKDSRQKGKGAAENQMGYIASLTQWTWI